MASISHPLSPQTQKPLIPHRRASSAPDLRSTTESVSGSSGEPGPSRSSMSLRPVHSQRGWHPYEDRQPGSQTTPPSSAHNRPRSRGSTPVPEPSPGLAPTSGLNEEISQNMELMARRLEEIRRNLSRRQRRASRPTWQGLWTAARGFFGYGPEGTAARREIVSLAAKLAFGTAQIITTIALLCIGALEKSPLDDSLNEWQACQRPLGVWCAIWCIRVVFGSLTAIWAYRRKSARLAVTAERLERGEPSIVGPVHTSPQESGTTRQGDRRTNSQPHSTPATASNQISEVTFVRLTMLLSFLSLSWFITAHTFLYTSVHTCRFSAPHLWWLTFGIICIGYLVIVEVILVAFLVFILGPLIFIFLNTILICMGRSPMGHPGVNPEVGKLSHKAVDRIPLVLYIPAPKVPSTGDADQPNSPSLPQESTPQVTAPEPAGHHPYPPKPERVDESPSVSIPSRSRRLFTFRRIRLKRTRKDKDQKGKEKQSGIPDEGDGHVYEDKWEKGEYPFVKLEDNRAACAICLCDFEEPRRVRYSLDSRPPLDLDEEEKHVATGTAPADRPGRLELTDPGEGAQPLRLLDCAHVFHKTCLDPWLTEISGRCPVCQRPVVIEESNERK